MSKVKILFLDSSTTRPKTNLSYQLKFKSLSTLFDGSIIAPLEWKTQSGIKKIGNLNLYSFMFYWGNAGIRNLLIIKNIFPRALKLYFFKKEKFQIIISPNPLMAGLIAIFLGKFTGAKVVIELNGNFDSALKHDSKDGISKVTKAKEKIALMLISYVLKRASIVRLLYKKQMDGLRIKNKDKINTVHFANFVAITEFLNAPKKNEKYILAMGHPFYLKGFDVLIQAFVRISDKFPEYKLKIVGYCIEDIDYFKNLANGNKNVEIHDPVEYEAAIKLMTNCSLFILPSRTEAMGRVLLEAMASRKPIIASNVGGIPAVINDKYNGLLFESENIEDLTKKIDTMLSDLDYAHELAENGHNFVKKNLSEKRYLENVDKMIKSILDK